MYVEECCVQEYEERLKAVGRVDTPHVDQAEAELDSLFKEAGVGRSAPQQQTHRTGSGVGACAPTAGDMTFTGLEETAMGLSSSGAQPSSGSGAPLTGAARAARPNLEQMDPERKVCVCVCGARYRLSQSEHVLKLFR